MKARERRNSRIAQAKSYAIVGKYDRAYNLCRYAAKSYPLTEMQLWAIKSIVGYKFEELGFDKLPKEVKS